MATLNDTQLTILAAAAERPDHRVLPLPTTLKAPAVAVTKTLNRLIADGLVRAITASPDDTMWQQTEEYGKTTLVVTPAGLAAIGFEPEPQDGPTKPHTRPKRGKAGRRATGVAKGARGRASGRRGGKDGPRETKQHAVIALLRRKEGATIEEMMEATGWQAHSVRGFMSGALKKRLDLSLVSEKREDGVRRYRIATEG